MSIESLWRVCGVACLDLSVVNAEACALMDNGSDSSVAMCQANVVDQITLLAPVRSSQARVSMCVFLS